MRFGLVAICLAALSASVAGAGNLRKQGAGDGSKAFLELQSETKSPSYSLPPAVGLEKPGRPLFAPSYKGPSALGGLPLQYPPLSQFTRGRQRGAPAGANAAMASMNMQKGAANAMASAASAAGSSAASLQQIAKMLLKQNQQSMMMQQKLISTLSEEVHTMHDQQETDRMGRQEEMMQSRLQEQTIKASLSMTPAATPAQPAPATGDVVTGDTGGAVLPTGDTSGQGSTAIQPVLPTPISDASSQGIVKGPPPVLPVSASQEAAVQHVFAPELTPMEKVQRSIPGFDKPQPLMPSVIGAPVETSPKQMPSGIMTPPIVAQPTTMLA